MSAECAGAVHDKTTAVFSCQRPLDLIDSVCVCDVAPLPPSCVQKNAGQAELRELRSRLNAARAEVTVAQSDLVVARTEETRKRELKAAQEKEDKDATLGELWGAWRGCTHRFQHTQRGPAASAAQHSTHAATY